MSRVSAPPSSLPPLPWDDAAKPVQWRRCRFVVRADCGVQGRHLVSAMKREGRRRPSPGRTSGGVARNTQRLRRRRPSRWEPDYPRSPPRTAKTSVGEGLSEEATAAAGAPRWPSTRSGARQAPRGVLRALFSPRADLARRSQRVPLPGRRTSVNSMARAPCNWTSSTQALGQGRLAEMQGGKRGIRQTGSRCAGELSDRSGSPRRRCSSPLCPAVARPSRQPSRRSTGYTD